MSRRSLPRVLAMLAAALLVAAPPAAHERWVRHVLLRPFDRTLFDRLCWANALTALGVFLALAWSWHGKRRDAVVAPRSRSLAALGAWSPAILRWCYGATLVTFALRGLYLAPDLRAVPTVESRLLVALEGVAGVLLLAGHRTRLAALLSLLVYAWALLRRPFEAYEGVPIAFLDVLSYSEVVGIGLYLVVSRSGPLGLDRWRTSHGEFGLRNRRLALALLRVALGVTLVLLGLVKFLIPELFMGVVQNYPELFHTPFEQLFGASEEEVVFGACALEILLGLCLTLGVHTRLAAALLGTVFLTTAVLFREEVVGHLPLVGTVFVLVLEGGGSLRPRPDEASTGLLAAREAVVRPLTARAAAAAAVGLALALGVVSFRLTYAAKAVWQVPLGAARHSGTYPGHRSRCIATLEIVPAGTGLNRFFSIESTVLDAESLAPVEDVSLTVDVTMPEHGHGMPTLPRTRALGAGRYLTEGCKLHMFGAWVIRVDVERGGEAWDCVTAAYDFRPSL